MALTNAEKQAAWRARRNALAASHPDVVEHTLLQDAKRCGELSDPERAALANKLADLANRYLWRAHELAKLAQKVRTGF